MERKYYLRGLGLGIAVTAVIMGIALPGSKAMTNDEIIARAKELGMVENTVLADAGTEETVDENADDDNTVGQDITDFPPQDGAESGPDDQAEQSGVQDDATIVGDDESGEDDDDTGESNIQTESDDDTGIDDTVPVTADDEEIGETKEPEVSVTVPAVRVITINSGDGSYTVAKKLADAGVVTSAENFDTFLCENGYDKRLRTGNFSIPADASDEQIARIVTGLE